MANGKAPAGDPSRVRRHIRKFAGLYVTPGLMADILRHHGVPDDVASASVTAYEAEGLIVREENPVGHPCGTYWLVQPPAGRG